MNTLTILIVEDDTAIRNLICTTLDMNSYKYTTADLGKQGILAAASQKPDICLLDLGLPDMDGVDVIRTIRSWSNMPIIVISARSDDKDKIEALDAGADRSLIHIWRHSWGRINSLLPNGNGPLRIRHRCLRPKHPYRRNRQRPQPPNIHNQNLQKLRPIRQFRRDARRQPQRTEGRHNLKKHLLQRNFRLNQTHEKGSHSHHQSRQHSDNGCLVKSFI